MREKAVRTFLLGYLVVALPVFLLVLITDRFTLHLGVNTHHGPFADLLFRYGTHLADGWVPTGLALLLLVKDWRSFLMMGLSAGLSALVAQFIKHQLFPMADRPTMFLGNMPGLMLVPGVEQYHHNSFPSGHTTAAFSMCLALAVIIGRRGPAVFLVALAALLGLSRVYLSQHFTEDVLAGATIGTLTAYVLYRWLYVSPFSRRTWLARRPFHRPNQ